jgi:hypothetical protein
MSPPHLSGSSPTYLPALRTLMTATRAPLYGGRTDGQPRPRGGSRHRGGADKGVSRTGARASPGPPPHMRLLAPVAPEATCAPVAARARLYV